MKESCGGRWERRAVSTSLPILFDVQKHFRRKGNYNFFLDFILFITIICWRASLWGVSVFVGFDFEKCPQTVVHGASRAWLTENNSGPLLSAPYTSESPLRLMEESEQEGARLGWWGRDSEASFLAEV